MKNNFYFLYYFFDNVYVRWVRALIFFAIGIFVYVNLGNGQLVIHILPLYLLLILQELFIHFKLENSLPQKKITDSVTHVIECVDFKTRAHLERHPKIEQAIREICRESEVKYFNKLLNYSLPFLQETISEEEILQKASTTVSNMRGIYIHAVDIYASYLLLLDKQTKTLFNNDISEKDILVVLSWVRKQYNKDKPTHAPLRFSGSGAFDFFVFGWSEQLSKYASNFTKEILSQRIAEPIGRVQEYDLLVTALAKDYSSNVLLVGNAGIGKTSLIAKFVSDSDAGLLPASVSNKVVFKLHPERLLSGINNEGDLESRFVELFSELSHAGNVIVYIPNIENIFGGGGLNVDISGALVEYLRSNKLKIIGSTTPDAFQEFVYQKQEIKGLFDVVEINEPDPETALFMVLEKTKELQSHNNVWISFSGVKEACLLSDSYMNNGTAMPGRVIRLIEDMISYAKIHGISTVTKKEIQEFVQEKTHIVIGKPSDEESKKLLNLEAEIHRKIISQDEAVKAIADAMRVVRSGMKQGKKPIASFLFLGPTGVGKTQTAKALASSYFGDENAMIRLDMSEYQNPESVDRFLGRNSGHQGETIADKVLNNPFSLVLLDEFEKAYPSILDLFLQVLDEGRLTDNLGRTVPFNNTIIIATSNAGSEFIREEYKEGVRVEDVKKQLIEKVQQSNIFKPELINRFNDVIVFKPLSEEDARKVAKLFLQEVINEGSNQQILLTYDEAVPEFIAKNSYSIEFGARNIERFIEQTVKNQLSKLILSNVLQSSGNAKIVVEEGSLVIKT